MKYLFIVMAFSGLFVSCQPEPDNLKLLDELVVATNYDTEANFASYASYYLATDTIGFISNRSNDTILVTPRNGDLARVILNQVKTNLNNVGYTRVMKNENPDIGINVFIVNDVNLFQQVVYPGYYYPYNYGYGSYYYYNYPYVNTYATNTGALVVEILDLKNRTPDNKIKVVWTAYLGDIISTVDREKQTVEAIDQAFIQSSYLGN